MVIHPCAKYVKPISKQKKRLWAGHEFAITDRQMDRQTNRQSDSDIPSWTSFIGGYNYSTNCDSWNDDENMKILLIATRMTMTIAMSVTTIKFQLKSSSVKILRITCIKSARKNCIWERMTDLSTLLISLHVPIHEAKIWVGTESP